MSDRESNTWIISSVAYASITESLILISWYGLIRNGIEMKITHQSGESSTVENDLVASKYIVTYLIAVYALRLFVALTLFQKPCIFFICTKLGIFVNFFAGIRLIKFSWTYVIGMATLCAIALHFTYAILIYDQMKVAKAVSDEDNPRQSEPPETRQIETPARASAFVISPENNYQTTMIFPPPYTIEDTPPSYEAVFGDQHGKPSRSENNV